MSIRLLVVLGALAPLAMASESPSASPVAWPSASHTSKKGGKGGKPKGTKSKGKPKGTKSKGKPAGPPPPPPPPKECGPPYDKGCPCYNQKDVDALLALAAKSEGNCAFRDIFYVGGQQTYLDAATLTESNQTIVRNLVLEDFPKNQSDYVDFCRFNYFGYDENGNYDFEEYFSTKLEGSLAETTSSCGALMKDAKDDMAALNCSITCQCGVYGNGECTPDGDGCVCVAPYYDPAAFCDTCLDDGYFGYLNDNCTLFYPNCTVGNPNWIGDGFCDAGSPGYYTEECGWDGGDCCAPDDTRPECEVPGYPNCSVPSPEWVQLIGDGFCDLLDPVFYTEECGYEGGDCCAPDDPRPECEVPGYPNCSVPIPEWIGNGGCDGELFNTTECGFDGGDCLFVTTGASTLLSKDPRPETLTPLEQMLPVCKPASIKGLGK